MLGHSSPYEISNAFSMMSKDQVNHDVERFFNKYVDDRNLDGIEKSEIGNIFFMYIVRYLVHKDSNFDERMN